MASSSDYDDNSSIDNNEEIIFYDANNTWIDNEVTT